MLSWVQRLSIIGVKLCTLPTPHTVWVEAVVAAAIQHLLNVATCGKFGLQFQSIKRGAAKRTWHSRQAAAKGQRARQGACNTQVAIHKCTTTRTTKATTWTEMVHATRWRGLTKSFSAFRQERQFNWGTFNCEIGRNRRAFWSVY